jgi:alkanesulfonate monooxygenase SsuD/methylene tetrahydromethanopterin reductase-like flavin-dependent oxidoreductase (luciferase family)
MLDEGIDIMTRAWRSREPFSYHGKRWKLDDIWLNPRPHPVSGPTAPVAANRRRRQPSQPRPRELAGRQREVAFAPPSHAYYDPGL